MTKEKLFGVAVLGILASVFCGLLVLRLTEHAAGRPPAELASHIVPQNAKAAEREEPRLVVPEEDATPVPTLSPSEAIPVVHHDRDESLAHTTFMPAEAITESETAAPAAETEQFEPTPADPQSEPAVSNPFQRSAATNWNSSDAAQTDHGYASSRVQVVSEPAGAESASPEYVTPTGGSDEMQAQSVANPPRSFPGYSSAASPPAGNPYPQDSLRTASTEQAWPPRPATSPSSPQAKPPRQGYDDYGVAPAQPSVPPGEYIVQPGDSYWKISQKVYGTGAFFKAIQEHNRKKQKGADLKVGQSLDVPDAVTMQQSYPDLSPRPRTGIASAERRMAMVSTQLNQGGRIYVVEEGDTLFDIARYELGKADRWGEIYDLNRELLGNDFDYLRAGTELILPNDGRPDVMTRQPGETIRR